MSYAIWKLNNECRYLKAKGASIEKLNTRNKTVQAASREDNNAAIYEIYEDLEQHFN